MSVPSTDTPGIEWLDWHGCYDGNWRGVITDAAYSHPAKFARGLIERIVSEGLARGWCPNEREEIVLPPPVTGREGGRHP